MTEAALTPERILEAAEEVLRRFGPDKATVVDVARALGVSHGSVYRHFPSKAALGEAVAERWLSRVSTPLAAIAAESGPAPDRLRRWLDHLIGFKRTKAQEDQELFAAYSRLVSDSREVVRRHVETLTGQLTQIVADGVARGELATENPAATARAVFHATARFHNPVHVVEWADPAIDADFEQVFALLLRGLGARSAPAAKGGSRRRG